MSKYQELRTQPTEFLALTGYTLPEFEALVPHFAEQYEQWLSTHRLDGQQRGQRKSSSYRNSPLPTSEDKLFFILVYLKSNNLQTVQGALFGLSQPKANQWIHCLQPILNQTLSVLGELPVRTLEALTCDEQAGQLFFHDGTERPILRPSDLTAQQTYYSGKKNSTRSKITC